MKQFKLVLPYVAGVALVAMLLWQTDPKQIVLQLAGADPKWLLVGFGCYIVTNVLRAYRFGTLLRVQRLLGALRILPEMFALSLFNNTLPARSGELSFPYFMRRRHGVSIGESATILVVARIFGYVAVATLYVSFTLVELPNLTSEVSNVAVWVAALLLLSLVPLMAAPWIGAWGLRAARWALRRLDLAGGRVDNLIAGGGERVVATLSRIRNVRTYATTFGWSLLIWLCTFAWFAAFMYAIGLPLGYPLVVVGATFGTLAKAVPFLTVGGFGAHEAGWALGFSLAGMEMGTAISSGFAVNILTLFASLVFGGAALIYMRAFSNKMR